MKTLVMCQKDFEPTGRFAPKWHVIDAEGQVLGRLATQIAHLLRGKHKPCFTPNLDGGDFVVVVNAGKFYTSGDKKRQKYYHHHTGYPGGLKSIKLERLLERHPTEPLRQAVKRMLPKTIMGRKQIFKLKLYSTEDHPHQAQNPQSFPEISK